MTAVVVVAAVVVIAVDFVVVVAAVVAYPRWGSSGSLLGFGSPFGAVFVDQSEPPIEVGLVTVQEVVPEVQFHLHCQRSCHRVRC